MEVTDSSGQVEPLVPGSSATRTRSTSAAPERPAPEASRLVFEAIVYVLRTGCQWKARCRPSGLAVPVGAPEVHGLVRRALKKSGRRLAEYNEA